MCTISKETFEIMREVCGNQNERPPVGKFVKSKLINQLLWTAGADTDVINFPDLFGDDGQGQSSASSGSLMDCSGQSPASCESFSSGPWSSPSSGPLTPESGSSERVRENLARTWEILRAIEDDCSYCQQYVSNRVRPFSRHVLYTPEGLLACPVVLGSVCKACGLKGHTRVFCKSPMQNLWNK